jgi:hypothetical protein
MFDLNPIDVLQKREVKTAPLHFKKIRIQDSEFWDGNIKQWISRKLKGRYFVSKIPGIEQDGKLRSCLYIGFEEEKEMTYFLLACPYLRRN